MSQQVHISLEMVQKEEATAKLILEWRNDPLTRKMSFHQEPYSWDTFYKRFRQEYFCLPDFPPMFILANGERVGFLLFQNSPDHQARGRSCLDVSVNIAPKHRMHGYGTLGIEKALNLARQIGYEAVYADVKPANFSSIKLFKRVGFTPLGKATRFIQDIHHRILVERFCFELVKNVSDKVFIIAEAGSNWKMGSKKRDLAMIRTLVEKAKLAGADAVKFQVFKADSVYAKHAGQANYLEENGVQENIHEIFEDITLPPEYLPYIHECCQANEIEFMASAFSKEDFDAIDPFVKRHKVASYEVSHLRLLERAAFSQKPLILSTGGADFREVSWAVDFFRKKGGKDLTLLQCTAAYPAPLESLNLKTISYFRKAFGVKSGLSDHSKDPLLAPVAAVALGASVIEKHFTLHKELPGPDHPFALDTNELKTMVEGIRACEKILGQEGKWVEQSEQELRSFAVRALQATQDIKEGEVFSEGINFNILRPGKNEKGVHPKYLFELEGKVAKKDIKEGKGIQVGDW